MDAKLHNEPMLQSAGALNSIAPHSRRTAAGWRLRPAVFLDRDGVINIDRGDVFRPDDLAFTPTAVKGIRSFNEAGFLVVVVTNQSGVARGFYGTADVDRFHEVVQARLRTAGASIDAFYACPYHPAGTVAAFAMDHEDRKPSSGMLRRATREWPIHQQASVMIGDEGSDLEMAARAGVRGVLVPTDTCDLAAEAGRIVATQARGAAAI